MTYTPRRGDARMALGLQEMIADLPLQDAEGVEVGSYAGESALILVGSGKFRRLTCVDIWLPTHAEGEAEFDRVAAAHPEIRKLRQPSLEAASVFAPRSLDFVYLDADHRYRAVVADITAWRRRIRPGGYLTGHDFARRNQSVIKAVQDTLGDPDRIYRDGSWVVRLP